MERTVELIGFYYHIIGIGKNVIGAIVLGDTTQEGIAVQMALMHDMCTHGRCGGLTMSTCHTEAFVFTSQCTEHLCTLFYFKTVLTEILQFLMVGRYGWCVDY